MPLPTIGFVCGECDTVHSSFKKAEACHRARLLGHPVWDLSNPKDRQLAEEALQ